MQTDTQQSVSLTKSESLVIERALNRHYNNLIEDKDNYEDIVRKARPGSARAERYAGLVIDIKWEMKTIRTAIKKVGR